MKNLLLIVFLLVCPFVHGQSSNDTITLRKTSYGLRFYQGEKRLQMNELAETLKVNEAALQQLNAARSAKTTGTILGYIGGFMVGWPLGAALAGGDPNWYIAGAGAGFIAVAIPISKKFDKGAREAVALYNAGVQSTSFKQETKLHLSFAGNRLGLTLHL